MSQYVTAEGMGLYAPGFRVPREFQRFATKRRGDNNLAPSGCCSLFPVVTRYGGREQGQNRDKFVFPLTATLAGPLAIYAVFLVFAAAFIERRRAVIYTRYSCDLQSDSSNVDQEREIRSLFKRKGIDASNAVVIHDRAESATTNNRPGFNRMLELVQQGLVSVVGVDDQARASRNDEVIGIIKDLVFQGVRFVSGDGVDTDERGWQDKVRLKSIQNAASTEEKAKLVRRGMKGRILAHKSAGDFPYGFTSQFDDPEYAANWFGQGPKPIRSVIIYEPHAKWVRQIFRWVAEGKSFNKTSKLLQEQKAPVGRNVRRWTPHTVGRIVRNKKYIGEWTWGATMIIRDSKGRKKQVPAREDEVALVRRPDLRIVDQETWEQAQAQVAKIDRTFGHKDGQKRRGPKSHFSRLYPSDVLFKLLRCGACGAELHYNASRGTVYRQCKRTGIGPDDCRAKTRVPGEAAKKVLIDFAADFLRNIPDWLHTAIAVMRETIRKEQTNLPAKIEELRQQQSGLMERRRRLLEFIETGGMAKPGPVDLSPSSDASAFSSVRDRLEELDREIDQMSAEIDKQKGQLEVSISLPDSAWIAEEVCQLSVALRSDETRAAQLLGELFGEVYVYRVTPPGKQRGYHQLKFRLKAWRIIIAALKGQLPEGLVALISRENDRDAYDSPEFCLNVGGPTRVDEAGPLVVKLRREGAAWDRVCAETGLPRSLACEAYRRLTAVPESTAEREMPDKARPREDDEPPITGVA